MRVIVRSTVAQDARSAKGHRRVIARSTHSQIIRRIESRICCGTIRRASKLNQQHWRRRILPPGHLVHQMLLAGPGPRRIQGSPGSTNGITSPVHGTWNMVHIPSSLLSLSDENCGTTRSTNVGSFHPSTLGSTNRLGTSIVTLNAGHNRQMTRKSNLAPSRSKRPQRLSDLTLIQPGCGAHC